jgi:predicted DNA binding CopG/RHH family protein
MERKTRRKRKEKPAICVRMDQKDLDKIRQYCKAHGCTAPDLVRHMLNQLMALG